MVKMRQLRDPRRGRLGVCGLLLGMAGCTAVPTHHTAAVPHAQPGIRSSAPPATASSLSATHHETPTRSARTGRTQTLVQTETRSIPTSIPATDDARDDDATIGVTAITQVSSAEDVSPAVEVASEPPAVPLEQSQGYVLSLGNVLSLAEGQNPNVALARERINEAYARVDRAETLWLPSLRAGMNYNHHEGQIQDVAGTVFNTNRSAFYGGLGANGVGAGSPTVPGLMAQFHLSDAIFQPKIAEHQALARQFGAAAVRNDILRDTAVAYLELIRAEQSLAIAMEAVAHTEQLANVTHQFAMTGQGLQSDDERLQVELALRREQRVMRQEELMVASARLAQLLHSDPSILIQSGEPAVVPLDILELQGTAASYVATGLQRRPELAEQKHLVCEAVERLQREKYAPLVPSVLLGVSYGGFGGGIGSSIVNSGDRWDADAVAYWEIRNLGKGDQAAREETASAARQAQHREVAILDRVAREVTEAHTQVVRRQERLELARQSIAAAERSYALNLQRVENAQGLPIEALQSISALASAREAYLNAVIEYNSAQFELCRAIGWFIS